MRAKLSDSLYQPRVVQPVISASERVLRSSSRVSDNSELADFCVGANGRAPGSISADATNLKLS
jgi:hypothetical protein